MGVLEIMPTMCWKNTCLYHVQNIRSLKLTNLLHSQLITCTMYISEYKNKRVYLNAMKFKTKDQKYLGILLIFTPISLVPKKCGLSIILYVCVQGRIREWHTLIYTPFPYIIKFYMFLSLYIIDYLIGLAFFAILIGLQYVSWSGTKRNK